MDLEEAIKQTKGFIFEAMKPLAEKQNASEIREMGDQVLGEIKSFVEQVLRDLESEEKEKYRKEMQEHVSKVQGNFQTGFGNDYIFYGLYGQIGVLFVTPSEEQPQ